MPPSRTPNALRLFSSLLGLLLFVLLSNLDSLAQVADSSQVFSDTVPVQYEAELLESDKKLFGPGVQRLSGQVVLWQNSTFIRCDTAYFKQSDNSFLGVGHVEVLHNDSVEIHADTLDYFGNLRLGQFKQNVRMTHQGTVLTTHHLDFDSGQNLGYYYGGGLIEDSTTTLRSEEGFYYADSSLYTFKDSVRLTTPDYVMRTDTLEYDHYQEISYFFGPTYITSEENNLYCENGWYHIRRDQAQFNENARFWAKEQELSGDSLFYDRRLGFGEAHRNITLRDSVENIVVSGHYGIYNEKTDFSLVTGHALFVQVAEGDSLFLHADSLVSQYDSTGLYRHLKAYHKAKLFRHDFQAKCDSIFYSLEDSTIEMHHEPTLWMDNNQMTAEFIEIQTLDNRPSRFVLDKAAFMITRNDSTRYDQVKGLRMVGHFTEGKLSRIVVEADAESVYYVRENREMAGVNTAKAREMEIFLRDGKVSRILFRENASATLNPPALQAPALDLLPEFDWREEHRPRDSQGVFLWHDEQ